MNNKILPTNNPHPLPEKEYTFLIEMKVRDYECDLQGVVNNANYQHYMEHCRHEYLETLGDNFGRMHDDGYDAMVARVEIAYKQSLRSGDRFLVGLNIQKEGVRFVFHQDVIRLSDGAVCAVGKVSAVLVHNGELTRGEYLDDLLAKNGVKVK